MVRSASEAQRAETGSPYAHFGLLCHQHRRNFFLCHLDSLFKRTQIHDGDLADVDLDGLIHVMSSKMESVVVVESGVRPG